MFKSLPACGLAVWVCDRRIIRYGAGQAGKCSWTIQTTFAGQFATFSRIRSNSEGLPRTGSSCRNMMDGLCMRGTTPTRLTQGDCGAMTLEDAKPQAARCQAASGNCLAASRQSFAHSDAGLSRPGSLRGCSCNIPLTLGRGPGGRMCLMTGSGPSFRGAVSAGWVR